MGDSMFIMEVKQDTNGNNWYWGVQKGFETIGIINNNNGVFEVTKIQQPLLKLESILNNSFLPLNEENIFFGTGTNIIHLNTKITDKCSQTFNTIIRKVEIIDKNNTSIFNGVFKNDSSISLNQSEDEIIVLPFIQNAIRIKFSAIFYEDIDKIEYQYRLIGFDEEWSEWTNKTEKEYTYLPNGKYIFEVKARNIFDVESTIAKYEFVIAPPWYKTSLAFVSYIVLLILIIAAIVKLSIRKIEKEKIRLEEIVKERTAEIVQQKEEIQTQKEEIEAQRDMLVDKNEFIEKQNENITSSIQYASRIQQALLPDKNEFSESFADYFILFKPRDIVSGDFFWLKKVEHFILIAVADCTGHGVPGAFMSMLGIAFLNEIVTKREITKASEVLEEMRLQVKKSLKQKGNEKENKDGMDIAFLTIDTKEMEFQFAGAHNHLYHIRDNNLTKIKGDRQPIAVHPREVPFTNHENKIKSNDVFYMFSDGFPDQFGGNEYTKFSVKKLQNLLLEIHPKPFVEQKNILDNKLEKWIDEYPRDKNRLRQIDDILVIGLKI